jgi:hypothetical protein
MKRTLVEARPGALARVLQEAVCSGRRTLTMELASGYHFLEDTLKLRADDWDRLTIKGAANSRTVIGSGRAITGWQKTDINGRPAWSARVQPGWHFRQLFVDGIRQTRACWPKHNRATPPHKRLAAVAGQEKNPPLFPSDEDPANRFRLQPDDMAFGHDLIGAEVVCLHRWVEERFPIVSIDDDGWLVSSHKGVLTKKEHDQLSRYYIDNLRDALTEEGEWYLDYENGTVFLIPEKGRNPNDFQIIVPTLTHLIQIEGSGLETGKSIQFDNIGFAHSEWQMGFGGRQELIHRGKDATFRDLDADSPYAGFGQADANAPAAIEIRKTDRVAFKNCRFQHLGAYALYIGEGCHQNSITGCHFFDLGGGGIHLSGDPEMDAPGASNGDHLIERNHFEDGGHVFHCGIPILMRHTSQNRVRKNHIHDFYYSGISCGWVWWFGAHPSHHNRIEDNHIHSLGHRWLSDMGGIYILGEQPGTVVCGNHIHDISAQTYGAWGIYLDFSASHILVERNICHGEIGEGFVVHFGKENEVRRNILAFASGGALHLGKGDDSTRVVDFHRNILLVNDQPLYKGGYKMDWLKFPSNVHAHHNLIWNYGKEPLTIDNMGARNLVDSPTEKDDGEGAQWKVDAKAHDSVVDWLSLDQWQQLGYDKESIVADPMMVDPLKGDFRIRTGSPAEKLGFRSEA